MRRLVCILAFAAAARANPLTLAHFDGLRGDPVFDGAFALYWNPASLAKPGWELAIDADLIIRQATYDRDAVLNMVPAEDRPANTGRASVSTAGFVPGIAARWGRSLGPVDIGLAPGVFVENGGVSNWDKNYRAPTEFPGAIDGPQRWAAISATLLMVDIGVGLAVRHRKTGLSLGFTPILVVANFSTVRARNIDSSEDLVDAAGNPKEGRAYFSGSGQGFSAVIGARWDWKGWAVGVTYQRGVRLELRGDLEVAFGTQAPSRQASVLQLPVADTVRVGALLRATRWLSLRPMFECALWSILQEHVFSSAKDGTPLVTIPRRMGDVFGAKLRADAQVSPRWKVMLGFGGEQTGTPSSTMEPGFGENSSIEVGAGAQVALTHYVDLSATFAYQYFFPFQVNNSIQQPPTNGRYTDNRQYLIMDLEVHGWR
jgi:long-chain fatty acid transport protein